MIPIYFVIVIVSASTGCIPYICYIRFKNQRKRKKFGNYFDNMNGKSGILVHSNSLEKIRDDIHDNTSHSYKAFKIIRNIVDHKRDITICCNPSCYNKLIECINFKLYDGEFCSSECQLSAFNTLEKYID